MGEEQKHTTNWIRALGFSFIAVLLLLAAGAWVIKSDWLFNKIEQKIELTASEALEAEVGIGNVRGDIFSHLIIEHLSWKKAENSLEVAEIRIDYTIKEILFGDVNIRGVYVDSVQAKFKNPVAAELIPASNDEELESRFVIDFFSITDLRTVYNDDSYFKDTALVVDDFQMMANLVIGEQSAATIKDVSFAIESGKLPGDLQVGLQGNYDDENIKLNDILLKLGSTILNGQLDANLSNETLESRFSATPVYQQTIAEWTKKQLNADDINLQLSLEGNFQEFDITIGVNSRNINKGEIKAHVLSDPEWTISAFDIQAEYLNFDQVINDSTFFAVGPASLNWEGEISPSSNEYSGEWVAKISNPRLNQFQLGQLVWEGSINGETVETKLTVEADGNQRFFANAQLDEIFEDAPKWVVNYELSNINPEIWTGDSTLVGAVTLSGELDGFGFVFPDSGWAYTLVNKPLGSDNFIPIQLYNEELTTLKVSGEIGQLKTFANLELRKNENKVIGDFQATNLFDETPQYSYYLEFESINLGAIKQLEGNTTNINGGFYGIGNGKTFKTINLFGTLSINESEINGAKLDAFSGVINLNEGLLIVKEGKIESEIATGSIQAQRNLFDITDPDNRLNVNLELLNTQPLAGFFGRSVLQTTGTITGELTEIPQKGLEGSFRLNLNNIQVDSMFQAIAIRGNATVGLGEIINFDAGLNIEEPRVKEVVLQDIMLDVLGQTTSDSLIADVDLTITGSERGRLEQKAHIKKDLNALLMDVHFTQFDFITPESKLLLQKPFNISVSKNGFGTDTMVLASKNNAFLEFSIPYLSETDKAVNIAGKNFDLGLIQEIVFGERYLDGLLSGTIDYVQDGEITKGLGKARIDEINYKGVLADSLIANFEVKDERLTIRTALLWDNEEMVSGTANVPFVIDAEELDDEFYSRPVSGTFTIKPTNLNRFKQILAEAGVENTTGIVTSKSTMNGTAGAPKFNGQLTIDQPVLSGIAINMITSEYAYSADRQTLDIQSEIFAANTSAAEINIAYPFAIDFKTFEFQLPSAEDQLEIKAVSNNLNLALFNDFVDPNYIYKLNGELNADLEFTGAIGEIKPNGFINIRNGSFDVPYSGLKLRNIATKINVDAQKLTIERIYAESGRGRFNASGTAALNGLKPSDININTTARLFEISNTRDMKLVIDLDAAMRGELLQPEVTGKLTVNNGFYYLANFGEEAIEEIRLDDEGIDSFAPFDSLKIDMTLELRRDFYVRSRDYLDLQLEPIGTLEIAKERDEDIRLFGSLNADQGYIRPLGKRFEIERGTFQFIGDYDNPELDIRSAYVPQTRQKGESVILYYVITGTAENPEFSFESEPEMEQSDVICYTLFNKPCYSLDSWQSVLAEGNDAMAFQALADVLLDQVESLATRELGVDVVQIDNSGQNGATAIRTGWYLNDRTFFAIINEITSSTPKTLFVLEYILNEKWDLIITQGDDSRQGIDLRYQFDY